MAARSRARRRALDILFSAEMRGVDPLSVLDEVQRRRASVGETPVNPYAEELVRGVVEHRSEIDEQLTTYAIGWPLERMPAVDRAVLRIGAFELLHVSDVPTGAAIAEAVGLAQELSTDDSPRFVNGLLSRIAAQRPPETSGPAA